MKFKNENIEQLKTTINYIKNYKYNLFLLNGNIGAGKTTFVRYFLSNELVSSPTYTLVNDYENALHLDLYRIDYLPIDPEELLCEKSYGNESKKIFIEWAQKYDFSPFPNKCYLLFHNKEIIMSNTIIQ